MAMPRPPRQEVKQWQSVLRGYLRGRPGLTRAFVLIDSRHGILTADEEMFELLDEAAVTYQLVLTKIDKIKPAELEKVAGCHRQGEEAPGRLSADPCHLEREGHGIRANSGPRSRASSETLGKRSPIVL